MLALPGPRLSPGGRHADRVAGVEQVWRPGTKAGDGHGSAEERRLLRKAHQTLRHVTEDMEERWHFNTDIAMTMELSNEIAELEVPLSRVKSGRKC